MYFTEKRHYENSDAYRIEQIVKGDKLTSTTYSGYLNMASVEQTLLNIGYKKCYEVTGLNNDDYRTGTNVYKKQDGTYVKLYWNSPDYIIYQDFIPDLEEFNKFGDSEKNYLYLKDMFSDERKVRRQYFNEMGYKVVNRIVFYSPYEFLDPREFDYELELEEITQSGHLTLLPIGEIKKIRETIDYCLNQILDSKKLESEKT
jgi:hypothetical protein